MTYLIDTLFQDLKVSKDVSAAYKIRDVAEYSARIICGRGIVDKYET